MRAINEIEKEIFAAEVEFAAAAKRKHECEERLDELYSELDKAKEEVQA